MALSSRVSAVLVAAALVLGTLVACSSSSSNPAADPKSPAGFCATLSSAYTKCGGATACSSAMSAECTNIAGLLSPSILAGATTCLQSADCGSDPLSCLGEALGGATPSDAQNKIATDYCATCSVVGGDACTTAFFGTAQVPGLGFALLPFGDALLAEIDSSCTTSSFGKTACQAAFTTCVSTTTSKYLATSLSADSAKCLIEGIKSGVTGSGSDGGPGPGTDAAPPVSICGPDNCAGCCDGGGSCSTIDANNACGTGGGACIGCTGTKICTKGQCIDPSCKASCMSGCCSAAGCQTGSAASACGSGGNACAVCGNGQACTGGACVLDGNALFDFVAVGARVPPLNQSGGSWDAFSGLPDPYLKATSGAAAGQTAYVADTVTPVWNTTVLSGLSANALKADLQITMFDSDTVFDDQIGGCAVPLDGTAFDGALHTVACPATATGVAFSVDYRLKGH